MTTHGWPRGLLSNSIPPSWDSPTTATRASPTPAAVLPSLNLPLPQLWATYYTASSPDRTRPARDVRVATLIRAATSRRQLYEVMVDFWHNHFSIYAWGYDYASATWASYDRDVIRDNALGNFRALVEKVAKSTAMLYYLDNYISQGASFNENWGRELLELHTLGAENYLGTQDPTGVPTDPVSGLHVGYVDNDVYEAARCFTGWRVNNGQSSAPGNDGTFLYHNPWHDRANKFFLGKYMPADQGPEVDGKQVLDWLAQHPGTARFIVRKLWRRLIGDNTPLPGEVNATFDAAVAKWLELWNPATPGSDGQIREVVRILVTSPEFKTTWGQKIKRPHEALYGTLHARWAPRSSRTAAGSARCGPPTMPWISSCSAAARPTASPMCAMPGRTPRRCSIAGAYSTVCSRTASTTRRPIRACRWITLP